MLDILGPARRLCDGQSRRSFLRIGSLAVGGLALRGLSWPELLRAEETAPESRHRALIMVYLTGGLAHQDSFDLKPDAPVEIRGEFNPISTNVPGVQFGEHLPRLAAMMDKLVVLRSIVGQRDEHSSFQSLTGFPMDVSQREGKPNFGSVVARLQGPTNPVVPAYVDLFPVMQHKPYNIPGPGMMGREFAGVKADGEDLASMKLRDISLAQLAERRRLVETFDEARRAVDSAGGGDTGLAEFDPAYRRAFDVLTSNRLVDALDVTKEDPAVRDRYTGGSKRHQGDGAPLCNDHFLMARRLVEAGVRCVTVAYGFWDTHGNNFGHLKNNLPVFDAGIAALVEDLHQRGLADDVTLCVWGEFGRTPKINKDAGRDHWAPVNGALLAGGGLAGGRVIGSTDKLGAYAVERPVHFRDVIASLYHRLGIDPHTYISDLSNRPVGILPDTAQVVEELV